MFVFGGDFDDTLEWVVIEIVSKVAEDLETRLGRRDWKRADVIIHVVQGS